MLQKLFCARYIKRTSTYALCYQGDRYKSIIRTIFENIFDISK